MKTLHWSSRVITWKSLRIYLVLIFVSITLYMVYYSVMKPNMDLKPVNHLSFAESHRLKRKERPFEGAKIVHLDLKGAPPRSSYYKTLFPLLSKLGATGVLMEYEDMFPYNGQYVRNISALNAYTLEEISYINTLAADHNLEVIPLVQTFGHLEFLLKLEDFKELREVPDFPQVICPTHRKTLDLVMDMVDQMLIAHPQSRHIHIGADEVYHLGFCDRCASVMAKFNLSKNRLFLEHINAVTSRINKKYPKIKILMWDDEFRSFTLKELKIGNLNEAVVPVVWKYSKDVYEELGPSLWETYSEVFNRVWLASAFKGATGSNQYVTDVTHYVQNHRSWRSLVSEYKSEINFDGIIITGWQRYDHFAILCELLPVALPSLAMSLRVIMGYNDSPLSPPTEVAKILSCEQPYALIGPAFGSPRCSYLGGDILEGVLKLQQLKQEFDVILDDSRVKGWLSDYNKKYEISNPQHVQSVGAPLGRMRGELTLINSEITAAMYEIYDNYTIGEWKETYLKPFETELTNLIEARDRILEKTVWPRRPFQNCEGCNNEL